MLGKTKFICDANATFVGDRVQVIGWVHQKRNIGKIVFLVIRDRTGDIQTVFKDLPENLMELARNATFEDVLSIKGVLRKKKDNSKDAEFEIVVDAATVISDAESPPILPTIIKQSTEATRLKYRYLDLRSEEKSEMLLLRNNFEKVVEDYLRRNSFISIHTPILSKATPEGARDFLVQSREYEGKYYALPQSPQIYKQLIMASGIERYYQIAPSFRDEDARADRHQEFYEIDIEASYATVKDIQRLVIGLMKRVLLLVMDKKEIAKHVVFEKMKYAEAMRKYGTDKPDLRFDMPIASAKKYFEKKERLKLNIDKPESPILFLKGGEQVKSIKEIIEKIKLTTDQHDYKRGFSVYWFNKAKNQLFVHKYINGQGKTKKISINEDEVPLSIVDNVLIIPKWQDKKNESWKKYSILSKIRLDWGRKHLINETSPKFAFVWIINYPMFEIEKKTGKITTTHHPFTKPSKKLTHAMVKSGKVLKLPSTAFDFVCNGYELGSGSERINDLQIQKKVFECLKLDPAVIEEKFGFLLESMNYGTPPHAGIGLGFERILMVLLGKDNIRDVIPFPKTADGFELMTGSPCKLD